MDLNLTLSDLLEVLEEKISIKKENIELVIIKNHEIIEYLMSKNNLKMKYIATHEGFLFGY